MTFDAEISYSDGYSCIVCNSAGVVSVRCVARSSVVVQVSLVQVQETTRLGRVTNSHSQFMRQAVQLHFHAELGDPLNAIWVRACGRAQAATKTRRIIWTWAVWGGGGRGHTWRRTSPLRRWSRETGGVFCASRGTLREPLASPTSKGEVCDPGVPSTASRSAYRYITPPCSLLLWPAFCS
jgi:hypothetical protein